MTKDASFFTPGDPSPSFPFFLSPATLTGLWSSMLGSPSHGSPASFGEDKPGLLPPFLEPAPDCEKLLSPGCRRPEFSAWSLYRELSRPDASVCPCHRCLCCQLRSVGMDLLWETGQRPRLQQHSATFLAHHGLAGMPGDPEFGPWLCC